MQTILSSFFEPSAFTPHGFCLLWEPGLIWLQAASDGLIGLAYFSIPIALVTFVRRRRDLAFSWVFWLFAGFILACGTTHFMSIITLWLPLYWLDGMIKAATALISIATAVLLWPLLPRALAVPSPAALRLVNEELSRQIEERDRHVAALAASEAKLRQAQKTEAVGRLSGGIAHDFNNMLTVITGSLGLAKRQLDGADGRLARLIDQAIAGAERAATLTHRLLAFARQQPLAPAAVDANRLVFDMSELLRGTLGENYRLETVLAGGLWTTFADANQLESALVNLVMNARDAMPDGGRLTIETANVTLDAASVARLDAELAAGPYVVIAVSDTGAGMTQEVIAQAFEPFFTTKPQGAGTGLGLSQVFGFVKQSRGHVSIYSEPARGTTVRMYFPRFVAAAGEGARERGDAPVMMGHGETILLVEDDAAVRGFAAETLASLGYRVREAAAAEPALAILRLGEAVDLLLTDVVLPGANGRLLADQAREMRPGLRVLYTSGYTRDAIVHDGVLDPGVMLLGKPFGMAQLAAAVRRALGDMA